MVVAAAVVADVAPLAAAVVVVVVAAVVVATVPVVADVLVLDEILSLEVELMKDIYFQTSIVREKRLLVLAQMDLLGERSLRSHEARQIASLSWMCFRERKP